MADKKFHQLLEHDRIVAALKQATQKTTGDIRVFVTHRKVADPMAAAQKQFIRDGMDKTAHRHGVLIYVAPRSRNFAILADQGVHARCGDDFWRGIAAAMTQQFAQNHPTQAILHGIEQAGSALAEHFPRP